jgi:hypothetical protein
MTADPEKAAEGMPSSGVRGYQNTFPVRGLSCQFWEWWLMGAIENMRITPNFFIFCPRLADL